jgi:hypothetical protein
MPVAADLSEYRLVRALRAGQPGAFPSLWNAHVGSIWSVVRALVGSDAEALGWVTTFRVDLASRVAAFDPELSLPAQVGAALHAHLAAAFPTVAPLPEGPLAPTEDGLRAVPVGARLLYLLDLFFDVPEDVLVRGADPEARPVLHAVMRLLEPSGDTDARLFTHATLLRTPPLGALFLPPGNEPPAARPRWAWFAVGFTLVLVLASSGWVRELLFPTSWAQLAALHAATLGARELLLETDPDLLAPRLTATDLPSRLADVPDLEKAGLELMGGRVVHEPDAAVVLVYRSGSAFWTLQHHLRPLPEGGTVVAHLETPTGGLDAREGGDAAVVGWVEGDALWVLASAAPPEVVLSTAAAIREMRASNARLAPALLEGVPALPALQ